MVETVKRKLIDADKPWDTFMQNAMAWLTPWKTLLSQYVTMPTSVVLGQTIWALVGVPK